jgi:CBS domain-containing protein
MRAARQSASERMDVRRVVRPTGVVCGPFDRLRDSAAQLVEADVPAALVVADDGSGRPIGWLTPRDVVRALARDPAALADLRVRSAMSACARGCSEDTPLPDVLARMREGATERLVVVSGEGRMRGVVALGDLAVLARLAGAGAPASLRRGICEVLAARSRGRSRGRAEEVRDVMTSDPVSCRGRHSLAQAAQRLYALDVPCLPVLGPDGRLAGLASARDLCRALVRGGTRAANRRLAEVVSEKVPTCWPGDSLEAAEAIMRAYRVRRLPVVGSHGGLEGLLSLSDMARAALERAGRPATRSRALALDGVVETLAALTCRK